MRKTIYTNNSKEGGKSPCVKCEHHSTKESLSYNSQPFHQCNIMVDGFEVYSKSLKELFKNCPLRQKSH